MYPAAGNIFILFLLKTSTALMSPVPTAPPLSGMVMRHIPSSAIPVRSAVMSRYPHAATAAILITANTTTEPITMFLKSAVTVAKKWIISGKTTARKTVSVSTVLSTTPMNLTARTVMKRLIPTGRLIDGLTITALIPARNTGWI